MKPLHPILAGLLVSASAFAQDAPAQNNQASPPHTGLNGQTMTACTADLARLCTGSSLKQECLVQHWTKISSDCQDALAKPMRGGG